MTQSLWLWGAFNLFVLALLALDLGVFHRRARAPTMGEALAWTAGWVALALGFNVGLWHLAGSQKALEFFAGYVLEKSPSVDNLFVFALVFSYFGVPPKYQHKVLFWGILGALLMRGTLIGLGTALIQRFSWILYFFGAFLVFTGLRFAFKKRIEVHPDQNPVVRVFQKLVPVCQRFDEQRFFVREAGRLYATPLLVVLLCVEVTDLMFATDSIPAVFAVTLDPFIVYTSNVFAILGLRSLYFVLAGAIPLFHYLKPGLAVVLVFVGAKMLLTHTAWKIGTVPALVVVAVVLTVAILASIVRTRMQANRGCGQGPAHSGGTSIALPHSPPHRIT
jgi:TerC family integral membrane protein